MSVQRMDHERHTRNRRAAGFAVIMAAMAVTVSLRAATVTPRLGALAATVQAGPAVAGTKATHLPSTAKQVLTGQAIDVGYGTVQVQVTLAGGKITDVKALSLPQGGRSSDISSFAEPQLRSEALAAQSAQIDSVSGASYTSTGYANSLQSALDQAR